MKQKVYAIDQEKGGGGKSPTAAHLGYASSYIDDQPGQPDDAECGTLLIDLDPQATLSQHMLGKDYDQREPTVYDALVKLERIPPIRIQRRLFLLSAHTGLEQAEIELPKP